MIISRIVYKQKLLYGYTVT